ncbi:MAG: UDP-N-acetylglucosamine 2-epimerase (hydrolyzing), partial [Candidatus Altiarchaeota archaeon]|nr:UDP-N-acetylglucosamine 2-epimerase (hydrolyzing) [Candidatus Altiarchaeota archaeon]
IHGGDVSGGHDEAVRHAITKLSHIHFPVTEKSRERIIKLGEDPKRVFMVGAPGLDSILNKRLMTREETLTKFGLAEPYLVVVQHPVPTEPEKAVGQFKETLKALDALKKQTVMIYPNSDAGGRAIIGEIEEFKRPFVKTFKSLPHEDYLSLLKHAGALVGNSSSGIIETPSFHVPVVNIGIRQEGRERANNVMDVGHDEDEITAAIKKALFDGGFKDVVKKCKNPYGEGKAGKRIADVLGKVEMGEGFIQKRLAY